MKGEGVTFQGLAVESHSRRREGALAAEWLTVWSGLH